MSCFISVLAHEGHKNITEHNSSLNISAAQ